MCLLVLAWNAHPRYRLVLAANRDEYPRAPADPLAQVAAAERHPRGPRSEGRRHLARPRSGPPLRRRHELPRAAAAAPVGALPRPPHSGLPRHAADAGGYLARLETDAPGLFGLQPARRRCRPALGTPRTGWTGSRNRCGRRARPQQRVARLARGRNCSACAEAFETWLAE